MDCNTLLVKHCFCGCGCDHNANGNGGISDEMIANLQKELAELKEKVEGMTDCSCDSDIDFTDDEIAMQKAALQWARAELDIECWTGKYHVDGKKIYGKKLDFGVLPNNVQKEISHNISNMYEFISLQAVAVPTIKPTTGYPLPFAHVNLTDSIGAWLRGGVIALRTASDKSTHATIATIEYTCSDR